MTCAVEVCDREVHTRGWCQAHYIKWYRTGDPGTSPVWNRSPRGRTCSLDGCDEPHHARGYCSTHVQRVKKHGELERVDPPAAGSQNGSWLGDDVGYAGAHARVRAIHGSASSHRCCVCGKRAKHWAYNHADPNERMGMRGKVKLPYSPDPEFYSPMCVSCHKTFDLGRQAQVNP